MAFCKALRNVDLSNVEFTDRKKYHLTYPGVKVGPVAWVMKGQAREAHAVNHPQCVNIYAGITKYGVTKCHIVAGTSKHKSPYSNKQGNQARNITQAEYKQVLNATLLPEGSRIFSTVGIGSWVLQQDNDPAHRVAAGVVEEWNKKKGSSVRLMPNWPPSSPDLNPIENVWAYVQAKVNALGCKTFEEFCDAVQNTFKSVPKSMLKNLFASMRNRFATVLARGGDKCGY